MDIEKVAFETLMTLQDKAHDEGWGAFETITHVTEPGYPEITERFENAREGLMRDMQREWDGFAATLDDKQKGIYDRLWENRNRLRDEALPEDDRDLVSEDTNRWQQYFERSLRYEQLEPYRELEHRDRHIDGLRKDEANPEIMRIDREAKESVHERICLDLPKGMTQAEAIVVSNLMNQALLKYNNRMTQVLIAGKEDQEGVDEISAGLIRRAGRSHTYLTSVYDRDSNQLQFYSDNRDNLITGEFDGARLKQCIKNMARDLRHGWKVVEVTDLLTGEKQKVAKKSSSFDLSDTKEGSSAEMFFNLMAEVMNTTNWSSTVFTMRAAAETLSDEGTVALSAFADDATIVNKTYLALADDDRRRTAKYFAFEDFLENAPREPEIQHDGCIAMSMDIAKVILGDILQIPEFKAPGQGRA